MSSNADEGAGARIDLDGLLPAGAEHVRAMLYEGPYGLLPRDPSVTINVYVGVHAPHSRTAWHFHNGASFFAVLQGRIEVEFADETRAYAAGDVYSEPIGKVHRAYNPDPELNFVCVSFNATPPDREMVTTISAP
ncbi:MAG TPA: cupin domain-containing protein [Gaiellaceae bacterium]|jgi:quercetin dioxygenase-like cupin family protein|nr:cupin domain-containing protein [Gaiellaceae bacterium]